MGSLRAGRYDRLDFNSPLSDGRAALLLAEAELGPGERAVDLGCGWGELLIRAAAEAPGSTGDGVDNDPELLDRGRRNAGARGVNVTFHDAEAASWPGTGYDVAISIGSSHAWPGGTVDALAALHGSLKPGGRAIFGEGFWEQTPTAAALDVLEATPDFFGSLPDLVEQAVAAGFRPLLVSTAGRDEWEVFESRYCGGMERWLLANADHPDAGSVRTAIDTHRAGWLHGYRDVLGLAYLVLAAA